MTVLSWLFLALAAGSAAYSLIALLAVIRFLRERRKTPAPADFSPAISLLKPLYGHDPQLRANLESFCRQDYPAYEILFSVRDESDPAAAVVRRLEKDYPRIPMRLLVTGPPAYLNAKVHALELMTEAAAHEILVVNDSGVRVPPGYLRAVAQPFANPVTGLVTCIARSLPARGFWSTLEALGVNTQFNPGVFTAWLLLGMKFAIGKTMAVRKKIIGQLGGFGSLGQYLADDFVLGERVAQAGHAVVLLGVTPDNLLTDLRDAEHSGPPSPLGAQFAPLAPGRLPRPGLPAQPAAGAAGLALRPARKLLCLRDHRRLPCHAVPVSLGLCRSAPP